MISFRPVVEDGVASRCEREEICFSKTQSPLVSGSFLARRSGNRDRVARGAGGNLSITRQPRAGDCRRPIKMSPLCQIEMTLPGAFPGVCWVTVRQMSDGELTRLEVLRDLDQRRLTVEATRQLLGLERRQVFRLL